MRKWWRRWRPRGLWGLVVLVLTVQHAVVLCQYQRTRRELRLTTQELEELSTAYARKLTALNYYRLKYGGWFEPYGGIPGVLASPRPIPGVVRDP